MDGSLREAREDQEKMSKFQEWLSPVFENVCCKPSTHGWELIAFCAYETVAEIVDLKIPYNVSKTQLVDYNH